MLYKKFNGIRIGGRIGVSPVGDDTKLIAKVASKIKSQSVLDVGTGTGFIPIYLSSKGHRCIGVDINEYAIFCAKENAHNNNIHCEFYLSDLFTEVNGEFDLITFNPPFGNTHNRGLTRLLEVIKSLIPKDNSLFIKISYMLVKTRRQKLIKRFLQAAKRHLKKNGRILILLYPPEMHLIKKYSYQTVGKYRDFSLVVLRF